MKNVLQFQLKQNLKDFQQAIQKTNQMNKITGQQIILDSSFYFQALEDIVIMRRANFITQQSYQQLLNKLNGLLTEAKVVIDNKMNE